MINGAVSNTHRNPESPRDNNPKRRIMVAKTAPTNAALGEGNAPMEKPNKMGSKKNNTQLKFTRSINIKVKKIANPKLRFFISSFKPAML